MALSFENIKEGRKAFQETGTESLQNMPLDKFHEWALIQKNLFPDMLYFNTEEEIIDMFYKAFNRRRRKD